MSLGTALRARALLLTTAWLLGCVLFAEASSKIALIGLDGADWKVIDPLIAAGRMPNLAALRSRGASGRMISPLPLLSPIIWTTIATGRWADEHGVLDFVGFDEAGRRRPVSSYDRKCRALWNVFSEHGQSVAVYGYWATWPAESVYGEIASNILFENLPLLSDLADAQTPKMLSCPPNLQGLVQRIEPDPAEIARDLGMDLAGCEQELSRPSRSPYENKVAHYARILQSTQALFDLSMARLHSAQPNLFVVYFEGPDMVCHLFQRTPGAFSPDGVVSRYYERIDEMLGHYLRGVEPGTLVVVCSDHGFLLPGEPGGEGDPANFCEGAATYHRRYGIFCASGPGIRPGAVDLTPFDIAPTLFAAAGLPVAENLPGRVAPIFATPVVPPRVATYESTPIARVRPEGDAPDSLENLRALGYVLPSSPTYSVNLARVLLEKGDLDGAGKAVQQALLQDPKRAATLYDLFDLRVREGDPRRVIEAAELFLKSDAGVPADVAVAAVHAALESGRADGAAKLADHLSGSKPSALKSLLMAIVLDAQGHPDRAVTAIRSACVADPPLLKTGLDELIQIYLRWNPKAGLDFLIPFEGAREVLAYRGQLLFAERRFAEAAAAFEGALEDAPDSANLMLSAAQARFRAGDPKSARRLFERALEITPASDAALLGAGGASAALGDDRAAISYIERSGYQKNVAALNALALCYQRLGDRNRAAELLRESLRLEPSQPAIQSALEKMR